MEEIAEERSTVIKVAKVNVEENPDLVNRLEIQSIPTLLILSIGEVQDKIVGLVQKHSILAKLDEITQHFKTKEAIFSA